jgi:GntR family transcriptional regulator, transcriptional repressor for pyruvate dehydrogenase complex
MEKLMGIKAIKHHTVADEVISQLKELIIQGALEAGDRLPSEIQMCESFSVGRTTIREALKVLQTIGLVERSRKGTYVTNINCFTTMRTFNDIIKQASISDLYETRRALEAEIAALAAENTGEDHIKILQDIVNDMIVFQSNNKLFVKNDAKFHTFLGEACGNQVLKYLVKQLYDFLIEVDGEAFKQNKATTKIIRSHQMILAALKRRSPSEARERMHEHLDEIPTDSEQAKFNKDLVSRFSPKRCSGGHN